VLVAGDEPSAYVVHDVVGVAFYDAHSGLQRIEGVALAFGHDELQRAAAGPQVLGEASDSLARPEFLGERGRKVLDEPTEVVTQPRIALELERVGRLVQDDPQPQTVHRDPESARRRNDVPIEEENLARLTGLLRRPLAGDEWARVVLAQDASGEETQ
jgi:hypothetical protein